MRTLLPFIPALLLPLTLGACSTPSATPTPPSTSATTPLPDRYAAFNGVAPATKPRGMIIDVTPKPGKQSPGMGPPPYGYWRITGEPVPDWDQNPAGGPLGGGYS